MSRKKNAHTAHACTADFLERNGPRPGSLDHWELHIGFCQLFINGPHPHQWLAVSEPCYKGPVGTYQEREAARRTVQHLNLHHGDDALLEASDLAHLHRSLQSSISTPISTP